MFPLAKDGRTFLSKCILELKLPAASLKLSA
jgi:hypothetical protein